MTSVEVLAPGPLTTIQDLGRPGWAHIGVPRSGAADRESLRLANRLVGNADGAAVLETTLVGPRLRFDGRVTIALTGASVDVRAGDRQLAMNEPFTLDASNELRVGTTRRGLRSYVAFAGGIDVPLVLGSAATDVLTGLGPPALERGDVLRIGPEGGGRASGPPALETTPTPGTSPVLELPDLARLQVILGPRNDWFTNESIKRLVTAEFTVNQASNRIGIRLDGPALERARSGELRSEGLVAGAIQVPADGQPILLLADHPTTGGYPVIAVVQSHSLPHAAQLRPGQRLRFSAEGGSDTRAATG
jgi:biotin-dependent carboxylase-like uncharacterized protein